MRLPISPIITRVRTVTNIRLGEDRGGDFARGRSRWGAQARSGRFWGCGDASKSQVTIEIYWPIRAMASSRSSITVRLRLPDSLNDHEFSPIIFCLQGPSGGFSLVEILAGMLIALIGILVMTKVFSDSESAKRSVSSGGDAGQRWDRLLYPGP